MTAATDRFGWMDNALCAQVDPEIWFPGHNNATTAAAKRLCDRCVVTAPCTLWHASFSPIDDAYGIAGGRSALSRRHLRVELATEQGSAA